MWSWRLAPQWTSFREFHWTHQILFWGMFNCKPVKSLCNFYQYTTCPTRLLNPCYGSVNGAYESLHRARFSTLDHVTVYWVLSHTCSGETQVRMKVSPGSVTWLHVVAPGLLRSHRLGIVVYPNNKLKVSRSHKGAINSQKICFNLRDKTEYKKIYKNKWERKLKLLRKMVKCILECLLNTGQFWPEIYYGAESLCLCLWVAYPRTPSTRMHYRKKANQWRQCDALRNILLGK